MASNTGHNCDENMYFNVDAVYQVLKESENLVEINDPIKDEIKTEERNSAPPQNKIDRRAINLKNEKTEYTEDKLTVLATQNKKRFKDASNPGPSGLHIPFQHGPRVPKLDEKVKKCEESQQNGDEDSKDQKNKLTVLATQIKRSCKDASNPGPSGLHIPFQHGPRVPKLDEKVKKCEESQQNGDEDSKDQKKILRPPQIKDAYHQSCMTKYVKQCRRLLSDSYHHQGLDLRVFKSPINPGELCRGGILTCELCQDCQRRISLGLPVDDLIVNYGINEIQNGEERSHGYYSKDKILFYLNPYGKKPLPMANFTATIGNPEYVCETLLFLVKKEPLGDDYDQAPTLEEIFDEPLPITNFTATIGSVHKDLEEIPEKIRKTKTNVLASKHQEEISSRIGTPKTNVLASKHQEEISSRIGTPKTNVVASKHQEEISSRIGTPKTNVLASKHQEEISSRIGTPKTNVSCRATHDSYHLFDYYREIKNIYGALKKKVPHDDTCEEHFFVNGDFIGFSDRDVGRAEYSYNRWQKIHVDGDQSYKSYCCWKHLWDGSRDRCAFKCPICQYKTPHRTELRKHQSTIHSEELFYCPLCPYKSSSFSLLIEHVMLHRF